MNKNTTGKFPRFTWLLILCAFLMLNGCCPSSKMDPYAAPAMQRNNPAYNNSGAYKSSAPSYRGGTSTLNIDGSLVVKKIDGNDVNYSGGAIQVPEGTHTFYLNHQRDASKEWNGRRGIVVAGTFIAGRNYRMVIRDISYGDPYDDGYSQRARRGRGDQVSIIEGSR